MGNVSKTGWQQKDNTLKPKPQASRHCPAIIITDMHHIRMSGIVIAIIISSSSSSIVSSILTC